MSFQNIGTENYLKKISIFQNDKKIYFIGTNHTSQDFNILTFDKINITEEDKDTLLYYSLKDLCQEYPKKNLQEFRELNSKLESEINTKLRFLCDAKSLYGFFKLTLGYYAILVTNISKIGKIGRHIVNRIDKIKILPLFTVNDDLNTEIEKKYLKMYQDFDLCGQSYFSYTYDLSKSLQRNYVESINENYSTDNCFIWNSCHLEEFQGFITNKSWLINCIYGFYEQVQCKIYGFKFYVTIIARRNKNFAGTRYLKRGISDDGHVGNEVETEQILEEISTTSSINPHITSYIHIRGSVPIYWYQIKKRIEPKPDIKINYCDPYYNSTKHHFDSLIKRYGHPIIACNLTKKKEDHKQEMLLNDSYSSAINLINQEILYEEYKLIYYHFDLKHERKDPKFFRKFFNISQNFLDCTNIFGYLPYIRSKNSFKIFLQSGVIRSNCVDCLDRTNVFQQFIGTAVLFNQLKLMGIDLIVPDTNSENEMFGVLTEIYKRMGHILSSQYAGSEAHKQSIQETRSKITKLIDKVPEFINTFKRYFNNSWNDQYKQMCINLFMAKFIPYYHIKILKINLWDLTSDKILHKPEYKISPLVKDWWKLSFEYYKQFSMLENYKSLNISKKTNFSESNNLFIIEYSKKQDDTYFESEKFIHLKKLDLKNNLIFSINDDECKNISSFDSQFNYVPFIMLDIDLKENYKIINEKNYNEKKTLKTNNKNSNQTNKDFNNLSKVKEINKDILFSVDVDDNNFNLNDYIFPNIYKSDYMTFNDFNTEIIDEKVFTKEKLNDIEIIQKMFDPNNNEFTDDLKKLKKKKLKKKVLTNEEHIIYDATTNKYYKKVNSFFNYFIQSRNKSPKTEIEKPEKMGLKIIEDYF